MATVCTLSRCDGSVCEVQPPTRPGPQLVSTIKTVTPTTEHTLPLSDGVWSGFSVDGHGEFVFALNDDQFSVQSQDGYLSVKWARAFDDRFDKLCQLCVDSRGGTEGINLFRCDRPELYFPNGGLDTDMTYSISYYS